MNPFGVPGSLFRTQIDQSQTGFQDPMSAAKLFPGWGHNPTLMTPAYDAPYRPAYAGPNPFAPYRKPTVFGGLSQMFLPGYEEPYWGNPVDNAAMSALAVGSKPIDSGAWLGQRLAAPAIGFGIAGAMLGRTLGQFGSGMGSGFVQKLGGGAGMMKAGGFVGGLVGRWVLPYTIASGALNVADASIFSPYARARQNTELLQESFSGVNLGSGYGNVISGRGLSFGQAARLGRGMDRIGMQDMTFSATQMQGIMSMGMRAGLFDDSQGDQLLSRAKGIAAQVKLIAAIAKDPDIQNAIQSLHQLRAGGASISGGALSAASSVYSGLGNYASMAGMSVQRLMNTVGAQGQYMFQMNGMTPFVGQLAAGSAMAGFAVAQRTGLLGTAHLARMGGIDGATQSSVAAQLSASMTPYNNIALMNRYMGGYNGGSVVNNLSYFGGMAATNPIGAFGAMGLYGAAMRSRQFMEEGGRGAENQAVQYLQSIMPGKTKFSAAELYSVLTTTIGMTPDQAQAYISNRASMSDPAVNAQMRKGLRSQNEEQLRQIVQQEMAWGGALGTGLHLARKSYRGFKRNVSDYLAAPVSEAAGDLSDFVINTYDRFTFGNTVPRIKDSDINYSLNTDSLKRDMLTNPIAYLFTSKKADAKVVLQLSKDLETNSGPESELAREIVSAPAGSAASKQKFIEYLRAKGGYESIIDKLQTDDGFYQRFSAAIQGKVSSRRISEEERLREVSGSVLSGNDMLADIKTLHQAGTLYALSADPNRPLAMFLDNDLADPRFKDLASKLQGLSPTEKIERINQLARTYSSSGLMQAGTLLTEKGYKSIDQLRSALGGKLYNNPVHVSGYSLEPEAYARIMSQQASTARNQQELTEGAASSIDYGTFVKATSNFDNSVKDFGTYISKITNPWSWFFNNQKN